MLREEMIERNENILNAMKVFVSIGGGMGNKWFSCYITKRKSC
uniref:Uncharacterized protein n=1 Tax=Rhizophora mucronata TaxID=61149 RepID=A0A2P2JS72_RHIMU